MNIKRVGIIGSLAMVLSLSLAACGNSNEETAPAATEETTETTPAPPEEAPAEEEVTDAGADTFGPGCSLIPADGAGSFNGMATEPVATAASANPLLKTLVTAVGVAGLGDTLNSAEAITVFAPTDDAFAKIPAADLEAVLADKELLTQILTGHVVAGKLSPDMLTGKLETLAGNTIRVKGSGEEFTVGKENAAVLCGNIPTANATVYVIDTVLMP